MAEPAVTVAIASQGRETLARTLASLDAMRAPDGVRVDVLVADDDPDGGAAKRIEAAGPRALALRCVPVGARNIAEARNACLDAARGDLLAFIDDDERVAGDWLERLLKARREFGADCVFGPVFPDYPEATPGWMLRADPLHVDWGTRGLVVETGRSGNTLFDLAFVRRHGLRFDPAYGRTGGEDTAFFAAFHRAGGRLVVTDDAAVHEHVPAERLAVSYLRARSLRSGQSYARMALSGTDGVAGKASFALDAFAKMTAAYAAAAAAFPLDRAAALHFAMKAWSNRGKLRDVAGRPLTPLY